MTVSVMHDKLVGFFQRYLENDPFLLNEITGYGQSFTISDGQWQFTLPDLYHFCCAIEKDFRGIDYKQFRQLIYGNPTALMVSSLGGRFDIVENTGKSDTSRYGLSFPVSPG